MNTLERLRHLIAIQCSLPIERVQPEATLEALDIDSLALIELAFDVEEAFDITLDAGQTRKLCTVSEFARHIDHLLRGRAEAAEPAAGRA